MEKTSTYYRDETFRPEDDDEDPFADKYRIVEAARVQEMNPATQPAQLPHNPFFGNGVSVLVGDGSGQNFTHYEEHISSWATILEHHALQEESDRIMGILNEILRPEHLEERVTCCCYWTPFQDVDIVWKWVIRNGLYLQWSNYQGLRFKTTLSLLSKGSVRLDTLAKMWQAMIKSLGIDNIAVAASGHAGYRFYPVGYSKPQHHRKYFSAQDQSTIDTLYPEYWVEEDRL